jgi:hypothetical protein
MWTAQAGDEPSRPDAPSDAGFIVTCRSSRASGPCSTSVVDVSFMPALDPRAETLTLQFPSPLHEDNDVRSTIDLSTFEHPA